MCFWDQKCFLPHSCRLRSQSGKILYVTFWRVNINYICWNWGWYNENEIKNRSIKTKWSIYKSDNLWSFSYNTDLLFLYHQHGLKKENTINYCPNAVKWLYLLFCFVLIFWGSMPSEPPRNKLPPLVVAVSIAKKILHF